MESFFRRKCFGFSVRQYTLQKLVDFSSKPPHFLAFSLSFLGKGERFFLRYALHCPFPPIATRFRGHAPAHHAPSKFQIFAFTLHLHPQLVVFLWFMGEHNAPFNTSPVKENYSLPSHSTVCSSVLYPYRVKR